MPSQVRSVSPPEAGPLGGRAEPTALTVHPQRQGQGGWGRTQAWHGCPGQAAGGGAGTASPPAPGAQPSSLCLAPLLAQDLLVGTAHFLCLTSKASTGKLSVAESANIPPRAAPPAKHHQPPAWLTVPTSCLAWHRSWPGRAPRLLSGSPSLVPNGASAAPKAPQTQEESRTPKAQRCLRRNHSTLGTQQIWGQLQSLGGSTCPRAMGTGHS